MDIFAFHQKVIDEYSEYVGSFIDIRDDRIREVVFEELRSQELWPDPLVQFNPAYKEIDNIENLCASGTLHPEMQNVFTGFNLYEHQVQALKLGTQDQDFVVTSGTGSGKSLAYLGTIFNHVFEHRPERGILAILVYPMNALINSQGEEIGKYKQKYEEETGQPFPVRFAQYTGQETDREYRQKVAEEEPHILLTNYMMMELIMTRQREQRLRASIQRHLKYLVYDELHTYRGRQGADVGMLNRRIQEFAGRPLVCIGTSATMASGQGTLAEQREQVAEVAAKVFGKPFTADQIIEEVLTRQFHAPAGTDDGMILRQAISSPIDPEASEGELLRHPLACWLEHTIGLEEKEGQLVRRKPMTLPEITDRLVTDSGLEKEACQQALMQVLQWVESINLKRAERKAKPLLPFKLHQFIAQTGSVYVTLEDRATRTITLDAGYYIKEEGEDEERAIFPVAFSRLSGHDFICVTRDEGEGVLRPRDFDNIPHQEDDEADIPHLTESGYVLLDFEEESVWDEATDLENLPESWLNRRQDGSVSSVKKSHRHKIPRPIFFDASGAFSDDPGIGYPYQGWYLPAKLPLDPTTGLVYDSRTREFAKLARLGSEARSTSTSVLSRTIVRKLRDEDVEPKSLKLLSFTDNRQDASLQAGHFNDFNQVLQLRSAIHHAVSSSQEKQLGATNIARAIFEHLDLPEDEYAQNPVAKTGFRLSSNPNEEALKKFLFYRAIDDLRRSWRITLPNLEQCALLRIRYKSVDEVAAQDEGWKPYPGFSEMPAGERRRLLTLILDYFRTSYALEHIELGKTQLEDNTNLIRDRLKQPWSLDQKEKILEPYYLRIQPYEGRTRYTASVGYMSKLGRYLRKNDFLAPHLRSREDYDAYMERLLDLLSDVSFLSQEEGRSNGETVKLYRLQVNALLWTPGDGETGYRDIVRLRTYKNLPPPPVNTYFKRVYKESLQGKGTLHGAEHTGQISPDDRKQREDDFRAGKVNTLFCSPTMELGIDIADLSVVHMRNVPPNPSNYAQRSGRAGRSGQAALVVTYCSNGSPHDRHYFEYSRDMVAGVVMPPRIDLVNRELLLTHLHAVYMAEVGLKTMDESISELVDLGKPGQPLKPEVEEALRLSPEAKRRIKERFEAILASLRDTIKGSWFTDGWIEDTIEAVPGTFDRALNRWRTLYQAALQQLQDAQRIIDDPEYRATSDKRREALREEAQARRQRNLLLNEQTGSRYHSEFYPYRYLAAEGFLPGYNFTRLPIRAFLQIGAGGEYISRPRAIAIQEFGPRNLIYHNGAKYEINRQQLLDIESKLDKAKVSLQSGYFLVGANYNLTNCPITGMPLATDADRKLYAKLIELSEVRSYPRENITCEEEERSREGYDIRTYFTVDGPMEDVEVLELKREGETLLTVKYIPTARLYFVNAGWSYYRQEGFAIELKTGRWKKSPNVNVTPEELAENPIETVQLYTSDVADTLYIHPSSALDLNPEGVLTLQYALEKAVGVVFQVEQGEVKSTRMGEEGLPNIMIYEASEGSLGILSQVVEQPQRFRDVFEVAYRICYFDDPEKDREMPKATYDDLLSYYNQRNHASIDRRLIKGALEMLMACDLELKPKSGKSYDDHFRALLRLSDPNSSLEQSFLKHLYQRRLRLPDEAQWRAPSLYVQPDFFYQPNVAVFVDGSVHDAQEVKERDESLRRKLRSSGYRVITYSYSDDLDAIIGQHPDIFTPIS